MEKLPSKVQKILVPYISKLVSVLDDNVVSVLLYGSVTGEGYDSKHSDINVAVILKDNSIRALKPALKIIRDGLKHKITVPLFLTSEYINMSLDTFPIEFIGMRETSMILYGEDILGDVNIRNEDIRRECEYQLKGKLLTLRQAYMEQGLKNQSLEKLIKTSLRSLFPVLRNVLRIKCDSVPPLDKREILRRVAEEFDVDTNSFLEVLNDTVSDGRIGGQSAELFIDSFLIQLEKLSVIVDKL